MNKVHIKLHSKRGASITFALLLFLVCAVLCSVIITAASAASGRMASMAVADQRYYAVTSACDMLKEMIDGETVTIKGGRGSDNAGLLHTTAIGAVDSTNSGVDISGNSFISTSIVDVAAYRFNKKVDGAIDFDIKGKDETEGATCKAKMKVDKDSGDIVITVYKVDKANNPFTMEMTFTADKADRNFNKVGDDGNTSTIKTTTITWSLSTVKIVSMSL